MSGGHDASWSAVHESQSQQLDSLKIDTNPSDKEAFRSGFESLCKAKGLNRSARTRLCYEFVDTYGPIINLARGATEHVPSLRNPSLAGSLESLICRLAYATLKRACDRGAELTDFIKVLAELNKAVPDLDNKNNAEGFRNDDKMQGPLQELYKTLFGSYVKVLKHFTEKSSTKLPSNFLEEKFFKEIIIENKKGIDAAKFSYEEQITQRENTLKEQTNTRWKGKGKESHVKSASESRLEYFEYVKNMGRGSFGEVDVFQEPTTHDLFAVKRIRFDKIQTLQISPAELEKKWKEEIFIMKKLRHHHIVALTQWWSTKTEYILMIDPVADYHLRYYLELYSKNQIKDTTRCLDRWFGCLLSALAYTHKNEIRHRDIKPTNILIHNDAKGDRVYLCDFGLSKDFSGQNSASNGPRAEGTPMYRAPENRPGQYRGRPADIFSLACVFSEMFTVRYGKTLISSASTKRLGEKIRAEIPFRDCLEDLNKWLKDCNGDPLLRDTIICMLHENQDERWDAERALRTLKSSGATYCCAGCR